MGLSGCILDMTFHMILQTSQAPYPPVQAGEVSQSALSAPLMVMSLKQV